VSDGKRYAQVVQRNGTFVFEDGFGEEFKDGFGEGAE